MFTLQSAATLAVLAVFIAFLSKYSKDRCVFCGSKIEKESDKPRACQKCVAD